MSHVIAWWDGLTYHQQVAIILAAFAVFVGAVAIALYRTRPGRRRDDAVTHLRRTAQMPAVGPRPRGGSIASTVHVDRAPRVDETRIDALDTDRLAAEWQQARQLDAEQLAATQTALYHMPIADRVLIERTHEDRLREAGWRPGTGGDGLPPHVRVVRQAPTTKPLQRPVLAVPPQSWPTPVAGRPVDHRDQLVTLPLPAPVVVCPAPEPEPTPEPPKAPRGIVARIKHAVGADDAHEGATLTSLTPVQAMKVADVCPELPSWGVYTTKEHELIIGKILKARFEPAEEHFDAVYKATMQELLWDMPDLTDRVKPSSFDWTGEMDRRELEAMLAEDAPVLVAA